jgi:hypothetical protein
MSDTLANCGICGQPLNQASDPLSGDCGGDCQDCIQEIEAEMEADSQPSVSPASYSCRPSLARPLETWKVAADGLHTPAGIIPLAEITLVRLYTVPGASSLSGVLARPLARCLIRRRNGDAVTIGNQHFLGVGDFEDRTPALREFVSCLIAALRTLPVPPRIVTGMPPLLWWFWFVTFGSLTAICAFAFLAMTIYAVQSGVSWQLLLGFLAFAGLSIGPVQFLRATWRRRSRALPVAGHDPFGR